MRITLGELQSSMSALQELSALKFPAKVSYRLARVLKSAEAEMGHLRTAHFELVQRLGTKASDSDNFQVLPENMTQFQLQMTDLLTESAEIWGDPLPIDLLGDVQIEPSVLANLDWLVIGPEQTDAPQLLNGKTVGAEAVN